MGILDSVLGLAKKSAGVEIRLRPDGKSYFYCSILEEKNHKIQTVSQFELYSLSDLKIEKSYPVSIVFTGKGILNKRIPFNSATSDGELLNRILPNARLTDFYLLKGKPDKGEHFISAARKDLIDPIVDQLTSKGYFIINLFLGPIIIEAGIAAGKPADRCQNPGAYNITFEQLRICSIASNPESSEATEDNHLLSYSCALSTFIPDNFQAGSSEKIILQQKEFENKNWINRWTRVGLASLFLLLLINYFLFDHYYKRQNELKALISLNEGQLTLLDTLQNQFDRSKLILSGTGLNEETFPSYFLDRIASSIPSEISLTKLVIHPIKKSENDSDIYFERNQLIINGKVENSIILNEWIKKLKMFAWAKNVSIISFSQDKKKENGQFMVHITIG